MTKSFRDFVEEDMLFEMASIGTDGKMFFSVDTPFTDYKGNPYFKIYNTASWQSDSKVDSLSFLSPELIYHKRDNRPWKDINKNDMKNIIKFLKAKSNKTKAHGILIGNMQS